MKFLNTILLHSISLDFIVSSQCETISKTSIFALILLFCELVLMRSAVFGCCNLFAMLCSSLSSLDRAAWGAICARVCLLEHMRSAQKFN